MSIEKGLLANEDINFGVGTFTRKGRTGFPITVTQVSDLIAGTSGPLIDARRYTLFTDAVAAAVGKTLLVAAAVSLNANTTIGVSISLLVLQSGVISANGFTLTINGPPVGNPMHQWLSGFAAGDVTFGTGVMDKVFLKWFYSGSGSYSTALNSAIKALGTGGGIIRATAGTYQFDVGVVAGTAKFLLEGDGVDVTIFQKTANIDLLSVGSGGTYLSIENITFDGNNYTGKCLYLSSPNYMKLDKLMFKNNGGTGTTNAALYLNSATVTEIGTLYFRENNRDFHFESIHAMYAQMIEVANSKSVINEIGSASLVSEIHIEKLVLSDDVGVHIYSARSVSIDAIYAEVYLKVPVLTFGTGAGGTTFVRNTIIGKMFVSKTDAGTSLSPVIEIYPGGSNRDAFELSNYYYDGSGTHTLGHIKILSATPLTACKFSNMIINSHPSNIFIGGGIDGGIIENLYDASGTGPGTFTTNLTNTMIINSANISFAPTTTCDKVQYINVAGAIEFPASTTKTLLINCTGALTGTGAGSVIKINGQQAANADTSGATLVALETEVNELKATLRTFGLIAT